MPCEKAWLRSVTKVWITDTSACGRMEFQILWCRDCVRLIRSRFRDQVFETRFSTRFPRLVSVYEEVMAKTKDTSLGAAKVRAAANSIPGFADQEQENKTRGLQDYKSHSFSFKREHLCVDLEFAANSIRL